MVNKQKIIIITQARLGSKRLPNKILLKIKDESILSIHLNRLKKSKLSNKIILATTFEKNINTVLKIAKEKEIEIFQGSAENVLDRFYNAAKIYSPNYVVRVTSDCPLIDPILIDEIINYSSTNELDYVSNTLLQNFPDGQDIEVFKFKALEFAYKKARLNSEKEHVTPFIIKNSTYKGGKIFRSSTFRDNVDFGKVRMTLDTEKDYESLIKLIKKLGKEASWEEYANYYIQNLNMFNNKNIVRNEGYLNSLKKDKT